MSMRTGGCRITGSFRIPNESKEVLPQVKQMLIFTTFRPALSMGRPTPSRAVLSFSKISVKG